MTTLPVPATANFSAVALSNIDKIDFTNLVVSATATFASSQFDNVKILNTVLIDGSAVANNIIVAGGSINASKWTFAGWTVLDSITLNGSAASDTLIGSSQKDTINGGPGNDIITGGLAADTLVGGNNDDTFVYNADSEFAAGETLAGGNGTGDALLLNFNSGLIHDFRGAISGIEKLVFQSAGAAKFSGADFGLGSGQIDTVTGSDGKNRVDITGSSIDLTGVVFASWIGAVDDIFLSGTVGADTIVGSGQIDQILTSAGIDSLSGGGGDDRFIFNTSLPAGSIDGGTGNDLPDIRTDVDVRGVVFASVETLSIGSSKTVTMAGNQLGAGAIATVLGASANGLVVNGANVDLSGVTFTSWSTTATVTINGDAAASSLIGSSQKDHIVGGGQNDKIVGGLLADTLEGGGGNDTFHFDSASDLASGETIEGNAGIGDRLRISSPTPGAVFAFDTITLNGIEQIEFASPTTITAQFLSSQFAALTAVIGSGVADTVVVRGGSIDASGLLFQTWAPLAGDKLFLTGDSAANTIVGSTQDDVIRGDQGADTIAAGDGNDTIAYDGSFDFASGETVDGGAGIDTLRLDAQTGAIPDFSAGLSNVERVIFLSAGSAQFGGAQFGSAAGLVNTVTGAAGSQAVRINGAAIDLSAVIFSTWTNGVDAIILQGTNADGSITGSAQDDFIQVAGGTDTAIGGAGNDTFSLRAFDASAGDLINGGTGTGDRIAIEDSQNLAQVLIANVEVLEFVNNTFANPVATLAGTQIGASKIAQVVASSAADTLNVLGSSDLSAVGFTGWSAGDSVHLNGTSLVDTITGSSQDDAINGGDSDDTLKGGAGFDSIDGGAGNDTLDGGSNPGNQGDILLGGLGNDVYHVDSGLDLVDEGIVFATPADGVDEIISHTDFFWDFYSAGDVIRIAEDAVDPQADGTTVVGSIFPNFVVGNSHTNVLFGRGGADTYIAGDGIDFISLSLLGLTEQNAYVGVDGVNTVIIDPRTSGPNSYDMIFEFESGKDKIDVSRYTGVHNYTSGAQVLALGVNDGAGNSYYALGDGLDYVYMVGLETSEMSAADFIA